ncbi:MAG: xanthine dehydrogenase family protein molybdopterin-binding subunit [Planctomycetes bacterium]|nr:xanthine dehydrogenase family protein molybdopterin-binding subunit [Planctomycetota bacterium]MCB9886845.1 xanthine dehydrogenase family protein molybdopterin-binding subunit [Planctomycetota bacterium]
MSSPREKVEITVGYRSLGGQPDRLEKRTVDPEAGDAPPWDANTKMQHVGGDHSRVDGFAKATGRAKYTFDVTFPGMLQAMILRSPVARGKLTGLELDDARKMPGIGAVIALKEIGSQVRFVGDAVAAVAGSNLNLVRDALEKIRAAYDAESHIVDYLQSPDAPLLASDGEIDAEWPAEPEIEAALAAGKTSHAATYRTEVQTHSSLESHGHVARWDGNDLEVWASTQATFGVRGELSRALQARGLDVGSVTVHAEFVGGGFGSKFGAGVEGLACCLLAREADAPVKLMLDRFEEHTTTGNRPSALMQARAALDEKGVFTAWDWRSFGGCGFNKSGGRVAFPEYYVGKAKTRNKHQDIAADTDPARSMRAPGHPQGFFGAELFLDELAAKAGIDPLELRLRNDDTVIRRDQWQFGAAQFGWQQGRAIQNDPKARYWRGVGLASARWFQLGNAGRPPHGITCRIHQDGTVESRSGAQDIGTGLKTVLTLLTAEELGIEPKLVKATTGHTGDPSGPGSGGSTTTPSLAPAVRHAAFLAKQQLVELAAKHLGVPVGEVTCGNGTVGKGTAQLPWAEACKLIGPNPIEARGQRFNNYREPPFHRGVCGAQFAEVQVDSWTGLVKVTRMLGIQDCGRVIAKKLAESQVLGAMIQGVSYAVHEQRIMDHASGRMLNGDFLRYKIAGSVDLPELRCIMHSIDNGHDNVGAAGLGEPPSVAAPAAIANAVFHAIGVPVRHLPLTPDKVLAAIAKRKA